MKQLFLYAALISALCSCSIIGPAFTGVMPEPARTSPNSKVSSHYTPAEDPATGLFGFINDFGMWVIQPRFDNVQSFGSHGMARVCLNGRYGAIDRSGQLVIPAVFSSAGNANAAMQSIGKGRLPGIELWPERDPATGLFGYLDHYGRWAIKPQYLNCGTFNQKGLAAVQVAEGCWGAIDRRGTMVVQPRFNNASAVRNALQRLRGSY